MGKLIYSIHLFRERLLCLRRHGPCTDIFYFEIFPTIQVRTSSYDSEWYVRLLWLGFSLEIENFETD
ncbi:hypothetical protein [Flammeovirga pacifica]|uniref:Uncharacterized protein n=1 Tax=Flammeovirga pacifica TaxID=915059 RepID=A0A1S1Z2A5_FLAPC|nr:hypothetical protein [Flammeovirga pacifica]OHX67357.1 hypothetical protein NH26_13900 [Flammeovirga pacifica]